MEARNYNYAYEEVYIDSTANDTAIPLPRRKVRVKKKKRAKARSKALRKRFVLMVVAGIHLFMLILTLQSYVSVSGASAQITKLNKEIAELETERDYYKMEVNKYSSTERIEEIAKYKLGMYYPETDQYIYLPTEK
ncbi:cell division protein FtsL [Peptostreptococcaceae bacterium OttesenSCG-928-C18]|nr:cell division protein FtsL [Peptostreptococcaceae bacterium OttesenSCG-928-C18]